MNLKLKAKIIERFGTQADFGEAVGIDDSIISKIIRGRRTPNLEMQLIWAQLLAGEVAEPGTFSLRTLQLVRNLQESDARLFRKKT